MDFKLANEMADKISRGDHDYLYHELVSSCASYLLFLRQRFGFYCIPVSEVEDELAADAVSDAIMVKGDRNLPFTICLHNTFRDCCRRRLRSIRERDKDSIMEQCEIRASATIIGVGPKRPSAEIQIQRREEKELFLDELENHDPFSKLLIYQRMRGSTFPEMMIIFDSTLNECKRVYWHDFNHIRDTLRRKYGSDDEQ